MKKEVSVLEMRSKIAEKIYYEMPMDEICQIAHKQIYGEFATLPQDKIIRIYSKMLSDFPDEDN